MVVVTKIGSDIAIIRDDVIVIEVDILVGDGLLRSQHEWRVILFIRRSLPLALPSPRLMPI